jgi:hypothetical protein
MNHGPSDGFLQAVTYSGETYRVPLLAEAQPGYEVFEGGAGGGVPPPANASSSAKPVAEMIPAIRR